MENKVNIEEIKKLIEENKDKIDDVVAVKLLRLVLNYSIEEFAKELEISSTTYRRFEGGEVSKSGLRENRILDKIIIRFGYNLKGRRF